MTGGVAESWARLRLVQGDSTAQVWELVSSRGQTTLTVGSGPSSSWIVREDGVRPLHFSLHWDGTTLRIADTYGAGDVRVDGASVTAQWRSLVGRVRIDFGKAAIVAETSSAARPESVHPLEPSPLPQMGGGVSVEPASSQRLHKATLIGVSPQLPQVPSAPAAAAQGGGEAGGGFRSVRPSDSERAHKATLLGVVIGAPPAPSGPQESKSPTPTKGLSNRTLLGVAVPLEARLQLLSGLSSQSGQGPGGVSMDDLRSASAPAASPSGTPPRPSAAPPNGAASGGAITQEEVRVAAPDSRAPSAEPQRIGSSWHETPEPRASSSHPPMAVLIDPAQGKQPGEDDPQPAARPGVEHERYSDAPTQMRDAASLDSRRVREPFPWRYVGIAVLTAAAYFAWLYLLDHL